MLHDFRSFKVSMRKKELLCIRIVTDFIGFPTMTNRSIILTESSVMT